MRVIIVLVLVLGIASSIASCIARLFIGRLPLGAREGIWDGRWRWEMEMGDGTEQQRKGSYHANINSSLYGIYLRTTLSFIAKIFDKLRVLNLESE